MPMMFILLMSVLLSLVACGKSSSGSSESFPEEPEYSSEGAPLSSASITSATTVIDSDAVDIGNEDPYESTVTDDSTGKTYKTLTFGIFTWIDENISVKNQSVKSTCYAYDDNNCPIYGRLYMQKNASSLCPSGFKLPSVSDWEYRFEHTESPLTYGGVCYKRDTLECDGLKDSALYLAYGDSAVLLTLSGKITSQSSFDNGFYSLRCVQYRSIVYKMYELPDCKEDRSYNYPSVYVVDRDSSYSCYRGQWTDASRYHNCMADEEGRKYLVNGLVYICKSGSWSVSTIFDTDEKCTEDNIDQEYVWNNVRYACLKSGMTRLSYPESEFGLCRPVNDGKIVKTEDGGAYICDSISWRTASIDDLYGVCDEENYSKVVQYKSSDYVCRKNKVWNSMTSLEKQVGLCNDSTKDKVVQDTATEYKYKCVGETWQEMKLYDALGECPSQNLGDSVSYGKKMYLCKPSGWHAVSDMERRLGRYCTDKTLGDMMEYSDPTLITPNGITTYICKNTSTYDYQWTNASTIELEVGYCPQDTSFIAEGKTSYYKCNNGIWKAAAQSDVLPKCTSNAGIKQMYLGKEYICDTTASKNWFTLTSLDSALGGYCKTSLLNTGVIYDKTVYMCRKNSSNEKSWQVGNMLDYMGTCDKYVTYKRAFNGVDSSWCMCASADNCYWDAILLDSLIDERVNDYYSRYAIVTLGNQKWLNRELHYASEQAVNCNGFRIKSYSGGAQNTEFYYNWNEVFENLTTICPAGSHVATKAEWQALFDFAENLTPGYGVRALLERSNDPPHSGYNLYGVRLNRSGYVDVDTLTDISYGHGTHRLLQNSYFWLPESTSDSTASYVLIDSLFKVQYKTDGLKKDAYQVRCVVD